MLMVLYLQHDAVDSILNARRGNAPNNPLMMSESRRTLGLDFGELCVGVWESVICESLACETLSVLHIVIISYL